MADDDEKVKTPPGELASANSAEPNGTWRVKRYPRLESFALPGPRTEADKRWFQFMTREFGGAPERDSDL
jgi:hypothetical protein